MSWRDDVKAHLTGDQEIARRLWQIDAWAITGLSHDLTTLPAPQETAHLYHTVEEVTAAQQEYARAVMEYNEHRDQARAEAERRWNDAISPKRVARMAGDTHPDVARRLSALDVV